MGFFNNLKTEKVSEHIFRICDTDVFFYLIIGEKKSCLFDCGHGLGDSARELIDSLTDKPYFVILSHNHEDHISGAGWFDEVYISEKDLEGYYALSSREVRFKRHQTVIFDKYPIESYAPEFPEPRLLHDGQEFDLGRITLKVIECGGHTHGSIILLAKELRVCFYGDAIGRRVSLIHPGLKVSSYLNSLKHVQEYDGQYDIAYRCHNDPTVPVDTVSNLIDAATRILSHTDDHQEIIFGHPGGKGTKCYAAFEVVEPSQARKDGKIGNIFYIEETAC